MGSRRQHGEGSLFQRGKRGGRAGQWVAVADLGWKGGKRDRREFTGGTPDEAREKRRAFLRQREDGFTLPKGRPPHVDEWMLHWLHNIARPRVEATTWERSYRQKVTELIAPYFARVPLPELNEDHIVGWHQHLARVKSPHTGRPVSASTIVTAHRILSAALNDAVARPPRWIARNPAGSRTASPPKVDRDPPLPPDEDEVLAILKECVKWPTGPRWVTGIATGLRQGEVLGALWPNVDLDDESIAVEWELVRLGWQHGCDGECGRKRGADCPARHGGGLQLKRPKSEHSRARIPLAPYAAGALRQWRTDQKAARLAHPDWKGWVHSCPRRLRPKQDVCPDCHLPARPGLLVFTQPNGRPLDPRRDWGDWGALLEAAGLPHYRVHDSRHGMATMLLEHGTDIRVVQELMRHHSPDFTRRAYQHVRVKLRREAAVTIDRVLRGGAG